MPPQEPRPLALVIRATGTNCDAEMCRAFRLAGADVRLMHVDRLIADPGIFEQADLIGLPGGFSYGDDIASGRIFAARLREKLWGPLRSCAQRGVPMIGACNGFQVMVQVGLLPGPGPGEPWPDTPPPPSISLGVNAGGRFIDNWFGVASGPASPCIWTRGAFDDLPAEAAMLPIAHGEGRVVLADPGDAARLTAAGRVALRYTDNPNGSTAGIAGLCDASGRIFGLMPHPERFLDWTRHPSATRLDASVKAGPTPGLRMFRAAVAEVRAGTLSAAR